MAPWTQDPRRHPVAPETLLGPREARVLGIAKDQLNEVAQTQAIYNAVIAVTRDRTAALTAGQLTEAEAVQQLSGRWKQLKEDVGKGIIDAYLPLLDVLSGGIDVMRTWGKTAQQVMEILSKEGYNLSQ